MIGFICINKRRGDSSAYCVNKVKRKLGAKCGHMGTLDPLASGVLSIGVGQAVRLFDILLNKEKTYLATFDFSFSTPSLDLETEPCEFSENLPDAEQIERILPALIGEIDQVPPSYSAKFIDGKRSYKLARKGIDVQLPSKKVNIYEIKLIEKVSESKYKFEIHCGGGTYIRSIVRDMAEALGCCGVMTDLVRVKSGKFDINNSVTLEDFLNADNPSDYLIKADEVLDYPKIDLQPEFAKRLLDGVYDSYDCLDGIYKVYNQNEFWGVGEIKNKILKMKVYVRDL